MPCRDEAIEEAVAHPGQQYRLKERLPEVELASESRAGKDQDAIAKLGSTYDHKEEDKEDKEAPRDNVMLYPPAAPQPIHHDQCRQCQQDPTTQHRPERQRDQL